MILFRTLVSIPQGLVNKAAGGGTAGHGESLELPTVHIMTEELREIWSLSGIFSIHSDKGIIAKDFRVARI